MIANSPKNLCRAAARKRQSGDENMIPMINIVFLLLIFFMVASQISTLKSPGVELPDSVAGNKIDKSPQQLNVSAEGVITYGGTLVSIKQLAENLASATALNEKELHINLFADRDLNAFELDKVLSVLRKNSIASVNLFVSQRSGQLDP